MAVDLYDEVATCHIMSRGLLVTSSGEGEASVASSDDRCVADTSQDGGSGGGASEVGQGDVSREVDHNKVNDLAAELLKIWKDLKVASHCDWLKMF